MDKLEVLQYYCCQASQDAEAAKAALTGCFNGANRFDYVEVLACIRDTAHLSFIYQAFMSVNCEVKLGFLRKRLIEQAIVQSNVLVLQIFFKDGIYRSYCLVDAHITGIYRLSIAGDGDVKPIERSLSVDSVHNRRITYSQFARTYYELENANSLTQAQQEIILFLAENINPLLRQRARPSQSESCASGQLPPRAPSDNALHYQVSLEKEWQTLWLPSWFTESKPSSASMHTSTSTSASESESSLSLVAPKPVHATKPPCPVMPAITQRSTTDVPSSRPKSPSLFTSLGSPTYRPSSPACGSSSPLIPTPPASPFRPVY